MAKRPTISDVAKQAGLSVATVDRALTGRHRVRDETLRRIADAARLLGYHGVGLVEQRLSAELPQVKFGFLLLGEAHQPFFQRLGQRLDEEVRATPGIRGLARIEYLDWRDPGEIGAKIREVGRHVQALAVVTIDHPTVSAAVADLRAKGVPVFSLLSDFAPGLRESYVGLNNRKAGRAAGWFIAKMAKTPGKVSILVGSSRFHGHEMREIGFRGFFREKAPAFEVIDTLVNPGSADMAYAATRDLLRGHPDLVGLNVAGFGPEGVIRALREADVARRLIVVCNENTPEASAALAEEIITLVIDTPIDALCRELVTLMGRAVREGPAPVPGQSFLPFNMLTPESI